MIPYCINHADVESHLRDQLSAHSKKFGDLVHQIRFTNNVNIDEVVPTVNDAYLEDLIGENRFKTCDRTDENEIRYKITTYEKDGGFVVIKDVHGVLHSLFFVIVEERKDARTLTLHMLSVMRKFQGLGLGGMLLDLVDKIAQCCECTKVELYAVNVAHQQIQMYQRRGFLSTGTAEWPQEYISNLMETKRNVIHFNVMQKLLQY
jgi:ribosomal protein S18 acetylase RimI-like enzyme